MVALSRSQEPVEQMYEHGDIPEIGYDLSLNQILRAKLKKINSQSSPPPDLILEPA